MSNNLKPPTVGGDGLYDESYQKFLTVYDTHKGDCPRGVRLKLQKGATGQYHLYLQFKHPGTGKRAPRPCGVDCTPMGVVKAIDKAHKVKEALDTIPTVSEFWDWYDESILGKNTQENDLCTTYRDIFKILEDRYFAGSHRNTGKPRSRDDLSCQRSFNRVYVNQLSEEEKRFVSGLNLWQYNALFSGRSRSNCYFCFFQRQYEWLWLKEAYPELFEQAKKIEEKSQYRWNSRHPLTKWEEQEWGEKQFQKRVTAVIKAIRGDDPLSLDNAIASTSCGALCGK
ncbi:hypothetical protein [Vibrio sp.]|uniref:hypothetical protein n=1 Tax=Vibrio sp. TaxID=678 RepID=UPI003D0BE144